MALKGTVVLLWLLAALCYVADVSAGVRERHRRYADSCQGRPISGYYCVEDKEKYQRVLCLASTADIQSWTLYCPASTECRQTQTDNVKCVPKSYEIEETKSGSTTPATTRVTKATRQPAVVPNYSNTCKDRPANGYYCVEDKTIYEQVSCASKNAAVAKHELYCPGGTSCLQVTEDGAKCVPPSYILEATPPTEDPSASTPATDIDEKPYVEQLPKKGIPGNLAKSDTPMLVVMSMDDSVTPEAFNVVVDLLKDLKNPNGCPVSATFNVDDRNTKFDLVGRLYHEYGFEIASHSCSHRTPSTWWRHASRKKYEEEFTCLKEKVIKEAKIPESEIRGIRVPFLAVGGDNMYGMMDGNFEYDSSMVTKEMVWPFKLSFKAHGTKYCSDQGCPKKAYPDIWEFPLNRVYGCPYPYNTENVGLQMIDSCHPRNEKEAMPFLFRNFMRHYINKDKVPFAMNMHLAWFASQYKYNIPATKNFLRLIQQNEDVWIVSTKQVLEWVKNPTTHLDMKNGKFAPVNCKK